MIVDYEQSGSEQDDEQEEETVQERAISPVCNLLFPLLNSYLFICSIYMFTVKVFVLVTRKLHRLSCCCCCCIVVLRPQ